MPTEIERKFLVLNDSWRTLADAGTDYSQGYIPTTRQTTVRVRIAGPKGFITIKGKPDPSTPLSRAEYEYEIPPQEARQMLESLCQPEQIEKTRHKLVNEGHMWEIDVFHGANKGLVLAEIELQQENEPFARPDWLGVEVSDDPRYMNAALAHVPYTKFQS